MKEHEFLAENSKVDSEDINRIKEVKDIVEERDDIIISIDNSLEEMAKAFKEYKNIDNYNEGTNIIDVDNHDEVTNIIEVDNHDKVIDIDNEVGGK